MQKSAREEGGRLRAHSSLLPASTLLLAPPLSAVQVQGSNLMSELHFVLKT